MSKGLRAGSLILHKRNASPPSCAVRMLGDILGLQFKYKEPDLLQMEHKGPEFKKLNPMGTVPVLQDGDFIVSESHSIMKYLVAKYGEDHQERLYPREAKARALVDQAMFFNAGVMFIRLRAVALPTLAAGLTGPSARHLEDIADAYGTLEAYLGRNPYVASDQLTLADLSLGTTVTAMQVIHKLDSVRFPRGADWVARLEMEPFFKKINAPGVAEFSALLRAFWERNRRV